MWGLKIPDLCWHNTLQVYDLREIAKQMNLPNAFIIGAGAGPRHHVGVNCEVTVFFFYAVDTLNLNIVCIQWALHTFIVWSLYIYNTTCKNENEKRSRALAITCWCKLFCDQFSFKR